MIVRAGADDDAKEFSLIVDSYVLPSGAFFAQQCL